MKKRNKVILASVLLLGTAVGAKYITTSSALFSDSTNAVVQGSVGSLTLAEAKPLTLSNPDNFAPGDYDINVPDTAIGGTSHDLEFGVKNSGEVAAITRNIVTLSAESANKLDMSLFNLVEPGKDGRSKSELKANHKIQYSGDYIPGVGGQFHDTKNGLTEIKAVRYIVDGSILNGSGQNGEKVVNGVDDTVYTYGVGLSKTANNDYAKAKLKVEVDVQAIQHKNVDPAMLNANDSGWETIFKLGN